MRRGISLVAVGAFVIGLAACSPAAETGESGGPTTITFWNGFTSSDRPAVEELVTRFNDSQEDYTVEMTIQPWDTMYQKLLPAYQADEGPTIVATDAARMPGYVTRGVFAPVDDAYGSDGLDPDTLPKASLDATMWEGEQYGVPMSASGSMLYYNKALLAAAGVEPPTTLDELGDAAVAATVIDGSDETKSTYGLALPDHEALMPWPLFFWANGGGVFADDNSESLLDDPATIESMEYWTGLVRDQHISPIGLSGADADGLLLAGRVAMHIGGPWLSSGLTAAGIDYGVVPVPEGPDGQFSNAVSVNMHLAASATESERAAAYAFFEFWNSEESQTFWAIQTSYPPNRTDVPTEALAENPTAAAFLETGNPKFYQPGLINFADMENNVVQPTLQRALQGEGTVEELFAEAAEQLDGMLANEPGSSE